MEDELMETKRLLVTKRDAEHARNEMRVASLPCKDYLTGRGNYDDDGRTN